MTHDSDLRDPAEAALMFIIAAQDPVGGGWRYQPREAGDTSVLGWQLMALKSGLLGYIPVPAEPVRGASKFLDSVQIDGGSRYGYTSIRDGGNGTTAVGLLCRMYLGWKRDHPMLVKGVKFLDGVGPSQNDMYYNYYATQVMSHYGGPEWKRWNEKMRDSLISRQAMTGHEIGSWHFENPHGGVQGGRLCSTSLAAMTLEVYYRYLPIYGEDSTAQEFAD
jgi:hypothetical protein